MLNPAGGNMRLVRRLSLLGTSIVALAAFACNDPARPADAPATSGLVVIPKTPPSIRGVITSAAPDGGSTLDGVRGSVRVESGHPEPGSYDKAVVAWDSATRIARRDGTPAAADELARGVTVSVWFTGPVRESYPVQAVAGLIVVE
jgi:hypothetical protein